MGRLSGNLGARVNVIYVIYLSAKYIYTIKNKFILFYNFVKKNSIGIVSTVGKEGEKSAVIMIRNVRSFQLCQGVWSRTLLICQYPL